MSPTSALTVSTYRTPRSPSPRKISVQLFGFDRPIPFPKNSIPAPAVVTPLLVDALRRVNARSILSPGIGQRPRQSVAPRSKSKDTKQAKQKTPSAAGPSLWKTLISSGKGVIAETMDRDRDPATPYCATMLTPQMLREGLYTEEASYHAQVAVKNAIENRSHKEWKIDSILSEAMENYTVALGVELMEAVAGPHFTFVDPRNHDDARAMVRQALRLMRLFAKHGYRRDRIIISIPATEAGVEAAKKLERTHFVRTNLLYVSGLTHAAICAEAGASFVMYSYAALSHGIAQRTPTNPFARIVEALIPSTKRLADEAVESTAEYFRAQNIKTTVLLSGIHSLNEAQRLKNFDSVVLNANQSCQAKVPMAAVPPARTRPPVERSPGKTRAREAQSAASLLASGAFLSAMPAETREIASDTLAQGLKESMEWMHKTCIHILEHLQAEAQLAHIDDKALEECYEEDVNEQFRISVLYATGAPFEQRIRVRARDVGFRMLCSMWDRPETL
ncbi:aldolase [Polyporus arcularius HHB13444]|uniref:Aldolase n=1 Tax=Polyporus arcularius HHB13444 TaxID=1314778 RepID=A0A5C3PM40_9APHY|nr:aldolase [Polyporus arcularius HHB13444]